MARERATWKTIFRTIVVVCGLTTIAFYAFAAHAFAAYGDRFVDAGWFLSYRQGEWFVGSVDPSGPAAGLLRPGDRVLGFRVGATEAESMSLSDLRPGSQYTIRVERDGATREVTLTAPATLQRSLVALVVSFVSISVACFAVSLLLGLWRPEVWIARIGFATFMLASLEFLTGALDAVRPFLQPGWERVFNAAIIAPGPFGFAFAYHFFMAFPNGARMGRFWETLKWVFYGAAVLFVVPNYIVYTRYATSGLWAVDFAIDNPAIFVGYFALYRGLAVSALATGYAALVYNYRHAASADERRRLRWVIYGTAVCMVPYVAMHAIDFASVSLGGGSVMADPRFFPILVAIMSLFILIPATFGYTIVRHRIFDVDVAARIGMRYVLAKGVLEVVLALPIVVHVVRILTHPQMTVGELLFGSPVTLVLIVLLAVSLKLRSRLRAWVDRKYFRASYDSERILLTLVDEIKQHESPSDISRRVSAELEAALHPRRLVILYRDEEASELSVGHSSGDGAAGELRLSSDAELVRQLEGETRAHELAESGDRLPEAERELLRRNGITLVVPMTGTDRRLCGLLLLGEKRSEEDYSRRDRALLESVAAQMAMVYENTQLKSRVARDRKLRVEVLGRMDQGLVNLVKECPACGTCYDSSAEVCARDGAELTLSLPVERTVEGKYRLERLIGKGGMGAVYEGTDLRLARRVAVKILTGSMFGDRAALRRFEREAQASARLSHPNIVRVYDYGAVGDSGAFLVMELLDGVTLRLRMRAGAMSPRDAARILEEVFAGVAAAHEAGVVHRDLKPENILLVRAGEDGAGAVKLLDFGLAKMRRMDEAETSSLTVPGTIMGTFGYMSPEQLSGAEVDERSDVFSLGVIVYEMLVGARPYAARTWVDLIAATTIGNVRMPGEGAEVRRLERSLRRCLAGNARDRFATAAEAWRELKPAILACPGFGDGNVSDSDPTELYGKPL
jgi:hypothetical protein